jgi:hypothetical protein
VFKKSNVPFKLAFNYVLALKADEMEPQNPLYADLDPVIRACLEAPVCCPSDLHLKS